jgi:abortive infection bacteriophage resistance protein
VSALSGLGEGSLYVAEKKLRVFRMKVDERIELEFMQTKALLDQGTL